jgi:hypothetical protein
MPCITIKRARIWLCIKIARSDGRSNGSEGSRLCPIWPGYIINISGYDFRKGQRAAVISRESDFEFEADLHNPRARDLEIGAWSLCVVMQLG